MTAIALVIAAVAGILESRSSSGRRKIGRSGKASRDKESAWAAVVVCVAA